MSTDNPDSSSHLTSSLIEKLLIDAKHATRGPGGAIAVVRHDQPEQTAIYGFSDLERKVPMDRHTLFPLCSVSKQFLCRVILDVFHRPTEKMRLSKKSPEAQMNAALARRLPLLTDRFESGELNMYHLCNQQSGIQDVWAMTTAWGAKPEGVFDARLDGARAHSRVTLQHQPGREISSSNTNFQALAHALEDITGQSLGQLYTERIFVPAGMITAQFCPSLGGLPASSIGYEGSEANGYVQAITRAEFHGDCGIFASLQDMIAYERFLEREWANPKSLYRKQSEPQTLADGTYTMSGLGLKRSEVAGKTVIGHPGSVRGFHTYRCHVPSEHFSVIVLLNHQGSAKLAASSILQGLLGSQQASPATIIQPAHGWSRSWIDPVSSLHISVKASDAWPGEVMIKHDGMSWEGVRLITETHALSETMTAKLDGDRLFLEWPTETRSITARPISKSGPTLPTGPYAYAGSYFCAGAQSTFHFVCQGVELSYGYFEGFLGSGPAMLMQHVGEDIWVMACPRGMDESPPGDWTVDFSVRADDSHPYGVTIGCKAARGLRYERIERQGTV